MAATSTTNGSLVEAKLRRAWRKERRFYHVNGLCHFLLWLLALVIIDLVVDWLFLIPGYGRTVLLAINVGTLGWVVYHYWWRYLRRFSAVRTALQVERHHPELQSLLVSFVQIQEATGAAHASPSLIRALRRQAIEMTRPINFREIVSFAELKRIFVLSLCIVLFFGAISIRWSEHLLVLANRMLHPTLSLKYPTRTQILKIAGNLSPQQGDAVSIYAVAGGRVPESGSLFVRPPEGNWERLPLSRSDSTIFSYRFPEVYQDFEYYVRLGDARSETFMVDVVPPPRVVETRVRLVFPAYTGRKDPETIEFLNLEAPEGTRVEWSLRCDVPLARAEMILEDTERRPLTLSPDGLTATAALTPEESFSYQFRWTVREHHYTYDEDVRYFVQVIPDTAPQVDIVRPAEDVKATVGKTLTVDYQARDDYRLTKGWVVYTINEGEEQRVPLPDFTSAIVENQAVRKLREDIPDVKVNDVVTYAIEVADNHEGDSGPFIARSQTRKIYVVSVRDYLDYVREKRKKLLTDIKTMHDQEQEASDQVDDLKKDSPGGESPPRE